MPLSERTIPCSDYADWKHDLESSGYHVEPSVPDPSKSGFCIIRFDYGADHLSAPATAATFTSMPAAAALGALQKRTAQAIVNIFETGAVLGMYGQVTVIPGDTGHLTFGRSQTTLATGNLARLITAYCDNAGARFKSHLSKYLKRLGDRDLTLDDEQYLHNILRATADDPVMRDVQDVFFEHAYWEPAAKQAAAMQIRTPLGVATVYDSVVHGSWERISEATNEKVGTLAKAGGEEAWITAYIETRRNWMVNHARPDIRATRYRMDALGALARQGHWALELPLMVRDLEISEASLAARPPGCYDGPAAGSRSLAVHAPFDRGADVRLVQLGLSKQGVDIKADGVFGSGSAKLLKDYQLAKGLPATGVADIALIASLIA